MFKNYFFLLRCLFKAYLMCEMAVYETVYTHIYIYIYIYMNMYVCNVLQWSAMHLRNIVLHLQYYYYYYYYIESIND